MSGAPAIVVRVEEDEGAPVVFVTRGKGAAPTGITVSMSGLLAAKHGKACAAFAREIARAVREVQNAPTRKRRA